MQITGNRIATADLQLSADLPLPASVIRRAVGVRVPIAQGPRRAEALVVTIVPAGERSVVIALPLQKKQRVVRLPEGSPEVAARIVALVPP